MLVVVMALLSLGGFWLGTRAAGHAAVVQVRAADHAGLPWVEVRKGDTLWKIANALSQQGDTGALVAEIKQLNGLSDSLIRSNTRLYVPRHTAALR